MNTLKILIYGYIIIAYIVFLGLIAYIFMEYKKAGKLESEGWNIIPLLTFGFAFAPITFMVWGTQELLKWIKKIFGYLA
jgi:hypothetical protein